MWKIYQFGRLHLVYVKEFNSIESIFIVHLVSFHLEGQVSKFHVLQSFMVSQGVYIGNLEF